MWNNGKRRMHHAVQSGLGDAREVLGEDAAVRELCGLIGPGHSHEPTCFRFYRVRDSDFVDRDHQKRLKARVEHTNAFGADEKLRSR